MKKLLLSACALSVLFFSSCKKNDDDNNGGVTPGTRLLKTVLKTGSDSTVTTYSYNSAGKLISSKSDAVSGGQTFDLQIDIVRNSSGIIQKQVLKSSVLAGIADSIVTDIRYDATNGRYKNSYTVVSAFGFTIADSIVYNYDGSGKLVSQIDYVDDGSGYVPDNKVEYAYSGNNLQSLKYYSYDLGTSAFVHEETNTFEYDDKTNPLQFANEAPVLGMTQFYSANNFIKNTYVSLTSPSDNYVSNITYTYNDQKRPVTATQVNGSVTSTGTYTYQQ
jgi:hypothetical protein